MNMQTLGDPEIAARIAQYEMAYQMQASVPELTDLSDEPKHVLDMLWAAGQREGKLRLQLLDGTAFGGTWLPFHQLYARRLGPARQPGHATEDSMRRHRRSFGRTRQRPGAKRIAGGYSGGLGRRVRPDAVPTTASQLATRTGPSSLRVLQFGWPVLGSSLGFSYGESDDFGFNVAQNPVEVHDLQATILHQLGIDHERFTHRFQGLDQRLTESNPHAS